MRTPQTITLTIPAGDHGVIVPLAGKWLEIITCSAPNLLVGFDQDAPQVMYPLRGYPSPGAGFQSVRLVDTTGGGCTATVTISEEPLAGQGSVIGAASGIQVPDLIMPATGVGTQLILAANPSAWEREIHAPRTNGAGLVYLGTSAAHCTSVDKFEVLTAGETWWSDREKGAIYGCSSTGAEIVVAREC